MKCVFCSEEFVAVRRDAQFCSAKCRAGAYRQRLRLAARSGGLVAAAQEADDRRRDKHADLLTSASGSADHPRVALEHQILSQLPPAACRYRLVLGVSTLMPVTVMVPDSDGWNVMPFEPPSDPRLLPGHHYRIIWFDQYGREVPPLDLEPAPSLFFFLGKPNAEMKTQGQEDRVQTRTLVELRRQVQKLEAELAAARESCRHSEERRKKSRRKMRRRLRRLKDAHRRDSLRAAVEKWGPLIAAGVGGYALCTYRGNASDSENPRPVADEPAGETPPRAEFNALTKGLHLLTLLAAESYAKTNPALSARLKSLIANATGVPIEKAAPNTPNSAAPAPQAESNLAQGEDDVAEAPPADSQPAEPPPQEIRDELLPKMVVHVFDGPGRWKFQSIERAGGVVKTAAQAKPIAGSQAVAADASTSSEPEEAPTVKLRTAPMDRNEETENPPHEGFSEGSTNAPRSRIQAGQVKAPLALRRPHGS